MLFDNREDPHQLNNLIDDPESQALRASLESLLQGWLDRTSDRFLDVEGHIRELELEEAWAENKRYYLAQEKERQQKRRAAGNKPG